MKILRIGRSLLNQVTAYLTRERWRQRVLPMAVSVLLPTVTGCGSIRITSDPPGATIQRASVVTRGVTQEDWQQRPMRSLVKSIGNVDRSQIYPGSIQYAGETPRSFVRAYQVEVVRVIWNDDTESEWQMTSTDFVGYKWGHLHFVKTTTAPKP
jgi:uncharacterized protein YceK